MLCFCNKNEAKYKRWWTLFFHAHCVACLFILISLFFFGRLVFDDLDKRQFIHLSIHILAVISLLITLIGNRCKLSKMYFFYFTLYHLCVVANIGLEVFEFYSTPHLTHVHNVSPMPPLNTTRLPNGQPSPFETMYEETLYSLILIVIVIQAYVTFVVVMSFRWVVERRNKKRVHPDVRIENEKTIENDGEDNRRVETAANQPENKWEKRFETVGVIVTCITRILPNRR
ncbi:hypothetical protein M3Y94_00871200 [Aphelenchoides besseyi]|nr:hypothetical protein M3Y94_00871200 [Aphelenchoides besseyi]KAI6226646.1 hypothetical protein M3Y95_00642500 [Aphelenchoides besseyi]